MKYIFTIVGLLFFGSQALGQIPSPPEGQRWVLNAPFSDEFNESALDQSKWHDHHPYWVGRPPAMFLSDALSVEDGSLQIKNFKLAQDSIYVSPWTGGESTYTMAGGAVVSKKENAHYGFYEVRMKASRIRMSSTFWLKNRWIGGYADSQCPDPNHITELDIIEAVGGATSLPSFTNHMKSNTHYIHKECGEEDVWHSQGGEAAIGGHVSDDFHVYGCHWKDPNEIDFYIDQSKSHTIFPSTAESSEPFSRPMWMNLVTETYDWVAPPTTADLNNDAINTTYYDWVRSYYLVEVDEPLVSSADPTVINGGFESGDFDGWIGWGGMPREVVTDDVYSGNYAAHIVGAGAPEQVLELEPNTSYTLSCYAKAVAGTIAFGVKENISQEVLGGVDVTEAEYTYHSFDFTTTNNTVVKFYFFAENGEEGFADDFEIIKTGNTPTNNLVMPFEPSLEFYGATTYDVNASTVFPRIAYKASIDRNLLIELTDGSGAVVGSATPLALAGYGKKIYELPLTTAIIK